MKKLHIKRSKLKQALMSVLKQTNGRPKRRCTAFDDPKWCKFAEQWYRNVYNFLFKKLGPFDGKISGNIKKLSSQQQLNGTNGQYQPQSGDIFMRPSMRGNVPGMLGNLVHQLMHANLGGLYKRDPFYVQGFVDYFCQQMTKDPFWGKYQQGMYDNYVEMNKHRLVNARQKPSQFNVQRWRGQQWRRKNLVGDVFQHIKNIKRNPPPEDELENPYHND